MRIAIVGGHGQIALLLHPLLVARGHTPVAIVRSESYRAELEGLGAEMRILDIENSDATGLAEAFAGCDAVVFAAGGGPDGNIVRKRTVDLEGTLKSLAGAKSANIKRYVQVSAIAVDEPVASDASPVWKAYVDAKRDSDVAVRDSGLDWTIIRPGRLTDDAGSGLVSLAASLPRGDISRTDVAEVLAAVVDEPGTVRRQWTVIAGETTVPEAIRAAELS